MSVSAAAKLETQKFGPIILQPQVSRLNMTVYLLGAVFTMMFSTFIPQAQPFILTEILKIPADQQGQISGYLGLAHTIIGLLMTGVWGTLSDKTGRRLVYAVGFLLMTLGIFLYPLAGTLLLLFVFRAVFSAGVNACNTMSNTLLGDYVNNSDRGKAYGFVAFGGGVGALVTVFLLLRLPSMFQSGGVEMAIAGRYAFWIVAALCFVAMAMVFFGLMGRSRHQQEEKRSGMEIARAALRTARKPGILLAYGANFVASGAVSAMGTFFSLWLVNYGITKMGMGSGEALARAGMIIGIAQFTGLIFSPVFGVLADKIGQIRVVTLSLLLTGVSFAATLLISNPLGWTIIPLGLFLGASQIGGIISAGALIAKQAPEEERGAVMGFYGFCGALGIMFTFLLGGLLFDRWLYQGPFVLVGLLALIVALSSVFVERYVAVKG